MTDEELAHEAREGSERALTDLVARHWGILWRTAQKAPQWLWDDAMSDAIEGFIKGVYAHDPAVGGVKQFAMRHAEGAVMSGMYLISRPVRLGRQSKKSDRAAFINANRRGVYLDEPIDEYGTARMELLADRMPEKPASVDVPLKPRTVAAIESLSPRRQAYVRMRYGLDGAAALNEREIAELYGIAESTVRTELVKSRKALREALS